MENELYKITQDPKYSGAVLLVQSSPDITNPNDITLIKTPENKYLAVYPGIGPSLVSECDTELEAITILLQRAQQK